MTKIERPDSISSWLRRLGLIFLASFLLMGLIASLANHLTGRFRYARAAEKFTAELGDQVPDVSNAALEAQVAALAPPVPAEADNAARWLIAGAQAMVMNMQEYEHLKDNFTSTATARWTADETTFARDLVERNRGGLDILARAVGSSGSSYEVAYEDIIDAQIPNLLEPLRASFVVNLDARLAFASGDLEAGFAALKTLARLTESLRGETILIFSLVAHVTERLLLQGIGEVLSSPQPWAANAEVLERLGGLLPTDDLLDVARRTVTLDVAVTSWGVLQGRAHEDLQPVPWWRTFLSGHRRAAEFLDSGRLAAVRVDKPQALSSESAADSENLESAAGLGSAYRDAIAKAQLAMSQRQLVAGALEARSQGLSQSGYPEACPSTPAFTRREPYVGQLLACSQASDGSYHLEVPGAAEFVAGVGYRATFWVLELDLPPIADQG